MQSDHKKLIPDHEIQNIKNSNEIIGYISRHVGLEAAGGNFVGLCPFHNENTPSFSVNPDKQNFNCYGCGENGDVIKFVEKTEGVSFLDAINILAGREVKGERMPQEKQEPRKRLGVKKKADSKFVPMPYSEAKTFYLEAKVLGLSNLSINFTGKPGKRVAATPEKHRELKTVEWYPYFNESGDVDLMGVRIEDQHGKKDVLYFYWEGKKYKEEKVMKMTGYPYRIYNRHLLAKFPNKKFIIHEGEKCCGIATKALPNFVHITWNGGGQKWFMADWAPLFGREGYILPDDDAPGKKTAERIVASLREGGKVKIHEIPIFKEARKIKKKGADIEEILQICSPEEFIKTISNLGSDDESRNQSGKIDPEKDKGNNTGLLGNNTDSSKPPDNGGGDFNFKILGIADDGRAYFLDYENRMVNYRTTELNENTLCDMGTRNWFANEAGSEDALTKKYWNQAVDEVRIMSKRVDFNLDDCRGRGAWKDDDGNICYHDGRTTIGIKEPKWHFLRKPPIDIGINSEPCDLETRLAISKIASRFSFESRPDKVRLLAHATLAPFGGALTWRSALFVTGPSGSGKSTIVDFVAKPIALPLTSWGGGTSEAAIRQASANDSLPEYVDEMDGESKADIERINGIFSTMRSSTSDRAPVTGKGSTSGKVTLFRMRAMFCFVAVNDALENAANDNRVVRVKVKEAGNMATFHKDMDEIKKLLSKKTCRGIRAFTWRNLKDIIELGKKLELIVQIVTGQDARFAAGESILIAAYMIVWEGLQDFDNETLKEYVKDFYSTQTIEEKRDESDEQINRILDCAVVVGADKIRTSFREMLREMNFINNSPDATFRTIYKEYKRATGQHGLGIHKESGTLAIAKNHKEIQKILELGHGYSRQLARHKNHYIRPDGKDTCTIDGATKRCVFFTGFINDDNKQVEI